MSTEPKHVELTEAEIDREPDVLALPGTNRVVFTSDENQWSKARYRKYGWVERWIVSADDLATIKAAARREALLEYATAAERLGDPDVCISWRDVAADVREWATLDLAEPERDGED